MAVASPDRPLTARAFDRADALSAVLDVSLTKIESDLSSGDRPLSTRNLANGALTALIVHDDPVRASSLLTAEMSIQRDDGTIPWNFRGPAIKDENSIEFGVQSWGPILLGFSDRLPGDVRQALAGHARLALVALYAHERTIDVSYTNIFLLDAIDVELIGEALGDAAVTQRARDRLARWVAYAQQDGIHEYDSPQYYGVDLSALEAGYRYSTDPSVRATLKRILEYFWQDIAANYLLGVDRLAGAHSRDTDFLTEAPGKIDAFAYAAGWGDQRFHNLDLDTVYAVVSARPGGYAPDAAATAIVAQPQRVVEQRWGPDPGNWKYTFLTQNYAIGSANGSYGPQDKLIAIDVARGSRDLQLAPVVTGPGQDPYGKQLSHDRNGFEKPFHDLVAPQVYQKKSVLLARYTIPAGDSLSVLMTQAATVTPEPDGANVVLEGSQASVAIRIRVDAPGNGSMVADGSRFGEKRYAVVAGADPVVVTLSTSAESAPHELPAMTPPASPLSINAKAIVLP